MFIDQAKVTVKAGDGGDGCSSLRKDRYHRYGVPDGGPGGRGGDVLFRADANVRTLLDFHYRRRLEAQRGGHGGSNNKKGASGEDLIVRVPAGTILHDVSHHIILRDLAAPGDEVVAARGGSGGRGNGGGREARPGNPGQSREILLELKLIADVGLVGYPNAGKSTLISTVSRARPKIASYPFTTKEPVLGVVKLHEDSTPFVVADIPGLIEGAHAGKGLGDTFLRHIERTRLLIHIVDISGMEGRDPVSDYAKVKKELILYSRELGRRPYLIALNKIDIPGAEDRVRDFRARVRRRAYPVSALTGDGVRDLMGAVGRKLERLKR